jgi:hypothetical protein
MVGAIVAVFLVFVSVLCQYHAIYVSMALYYSLKFNIMIALALFFFSHGYFAIWDNLCLQMNFRIDFSSSVKNDIWDFNENHIDYVDCFWYYSHIYKIYLANS